MSRRRRRAKASSPTKATTAASASRVTRMARVQASAEVWMEFRALAGTRPISELLGELVAREVDRHRSQQLRESELQPSELLDALDRARVQQADLAVIVDRLEALQDKRQPSQWSKRSPATPLVSSEV